MTLTENVVLSSVYTEAVTPAAFPSAPTRAHYNFDGWYNNGTKYTSYSDLADITLTANWIGDVVTVTIDGVDDGIVHHYGDTYNLPVVPSKASDTYTVTFKYADGTTSDTTSTVTKAYTASGWQIGGTDYAA